MTDNSGMSEEVFALGSTKIHQKGAILLHLGDKPNHIFYLHYGTINCYRSAYDKMNLTYVLRNGFFADCWYFSRQPSQDEVIVEEESKITKFDHSVIDKLLTIPDIARKILHTLSLKSINGIDLAENIRNKNIKERLKAFIEQQFLISGEKKKLVLNLSQKELAALMCVHPVSISRAFSELKKEMHIETSKSSIIIREKEI